MFKRPALRPKFPPAPRGPIPEGCMVHKLITSQELERPAKVFRPVYTPGPPLPIRPKVPIRTLNPVNVTLKVVGNKVKLKLDLLSYEIHQKYFSKGKKPPLMEYIRALVKSGATEEQLNQVAKSYKKWDSFEYQQKVQDDIQRIFHGKAKKVAIGKKILKAVKKL